MTDKASLIAEGNALAKEKKWSEALECYRAAAALDPGDPSVHFLAGCCHFKLNHGPGARSAWERTLDLDPTYEKARVWIHRVTGLPGETPIAARR